MDQVADVLSHWGVIARGAVRSELGTMNQVWFVETDRGRLVLRGHRPADRDEVEFSHLVMDRAREGGVPAPVALRSNADNWVVQHDGRWWSLLTWIEGDQPRRGTHTLAQDTAMGQMLARIHAVLAPVAALSSPPRSETTAGAIVRIDQVLSAIEKIPSPGPDEASAARWLTGQRDWLRSTLSEEPPETHGGQTIHGDYHDTNIVFRDDSVVGVLDWDRTRQGCPLEEVIRAIHLSFRLDAASSQAFLRGYQSGASVTLAELDGAAESYGYQRDRSVWFFDELYRQGNERLRPLVNNGAFLPFRDSWTRLRESL